MSQKELVELARGQRTKREFADVLGVDRTTASRYESAQLGLSPQALEHCLREIARRADEEQEAPGDSIVGLAQRLGDVLEDLKRLSARTSPSRGDR